MGGMGEWEGWETGRMKGREEERKGGKEKEKF